MLTALSSTRRLPGKLKLLRQRKTSRVAGLSGQIMVDRKSPGASGEEDTLVVASHYVGHSATSYESAFFYSPGEYMEYLAKLVVAKLGWSDPPQENRRLLDIGGGTGNFTRKLIKGLDKVEAVVVDPFLESSSSQDESKDQVRFVKAGAEEFANPTDDWWKLDFHQVLMKEVIHHLNEKDRVKTFEGIQNGLTTMSPRSSLTPALLIITRPQHAHDYPLWAEAREVWAKHQPSLEEIRQDILTAGFSRVEHSVEAYPCSIQLDQWLQMIKDRFWSTFSNFTDEELEQACRRIARDEKSRVDEGGKIHFEDRLLFISACK